ncbi:MAG: PilZ domain-containing protein [Gammaproteobacteria bacterium]|nr:MAG: PilZ domain-containing protein [Gammaproteobacteria bacterium]
MSDPGASERRRSFRVTDRVALQVRALDDAGLAREEAEFDLERERLALVNDYLLQKDQALPRLAAIQSHHPDVAAYLRHLEHKIDQLAGVFQQRELGLPQRPTHEVNLSATGIRFEHDAALPKDGPVLLDIVIYPELAVIHALGRVVWCRPAGDGQHEIAVDFSRIDTRDADLLARHNIRTQLRSIRRPLDED